MLALLQAVTHFYSIRKNEWTNNINRGGLINVTDEFYIFIRHMEMSARNILNKNLMTKYSDENIQNLLMSEFNKNN